MADKELQIGQLIYILSHKTATVLPGIILEETVCKSLNGNSVSYKVAIGPKGDKQKIIDLTKVNGDLYATIEEVREVMTEKLMAFVEELCASTAKKAEDWYGSQQEQMAQQIISEDGKVDPATLLSDIEAQEKAAYHQSHFTQQPTMLANVNGYNPQQQFPQQPTIHTTSLREQLTDPTALQRDLVLEDGSIRKISINLNPKQ